MRFPAMEGVHNRQRHYGGLSPLKVSGVMVFSQSDLKHIEVALQSQMEREKRVLVMMEEARSLVEDAWWHQGVLEEQRAVVVGYEELLLRVKENL